eukprot:g4652.t1
MADTEMSEAPVSTEGEVDESLYSRQLYVMGHEAQRRMGAADVLICGLTGVGVEIAKNVILAGVRSVTLYDPQPAQWADLSSQFYLGEADVQAGTPRATACVAKLAELNQYVRVSAHEGAFDLESLVGRMATVVMVGAEHARLLEVSAFCRARGVKFIAADARGVFARVFCDFGEKFVVSDATGENPTSCMVSSISSEEEGLVTVTDNEPHGLQDGDYVRFNEVVGMEGLNDAAPVPVKVKSKLSFTMGDTRAHGAYVRGGWVHQVTMPSEFEFQSYADAVAAPAQVSGDISKWGRADLLHLGFRALEDFRAANGGELPAAGDAAQADDVVRRAHAIDGAAAEGQHRLGAEGLDADADELLRWLARGARGALSPMAALVGGVVGQEVLKACGGKFTPINGFWYFDAAECLPAAALEAAEYAARGDRYDGQTAVFGAALQARLADLRFFMVGAGAIGCEMLKNWALMGVAAGAAGSVTLTDMDAIERSNLNRQFLFRPGDVSKFKSRCAAAAAMAMNPAMTVEAKELRVGAETEGVFNDDFYAGLDGVCTALDNVDARLYVDQRCLFYRKPMFESGTEGPKGNTQIVVPRLTEHYGAQRDPPAKSFPICTVKNFPYAIEHTLQWAREWFEGVYRQSPADANSYLGEADFVARLNAQQNTKLDMLERIHASLVTERPRGFDECVVWARLRFEELFASSIKQLLHNFPLDQVTSDGQPFWSGSKRPPTPVVFDMEDELHMSFVMAAANLRAGNFGLTGSRDPADFRRVLPGVMVPDFAPKGGVKIAATDEEAKKMAAEGGGGGGGAGLDVDEQCEKILTALPPPAELAGYRLQPVEFEKDDDAHMEMVVACSNLRARVYKITEADKHKSKLIAGKIIPAIATTTAAVTGLVCLEVYKVLQGKPLEAYRSNFVNLALGFIASSEPSPPETTTTLVKGEEWNWSAWDSLDVDKGDLTLGDFIDFLEEEYGIEVQMISYGVSILFSFFGNAKKMRERKTMPISAVVEQVTKAPIDPSKRYLIIEVCATDEEGEDVEIPYARVTLPPRT